LQNAFIFIKEGSTTDLKKLSDFSFPLPAEEVEIDQLGCTYSPHVAGVRAGQKVTFTNSDQTVHNVNAQPKTNEKFNQSQAAGAPPITKTFCQPEQAVKVKCNQHGWMSAWVNVMSHPFFAVSDANGAFAIKGIPPGRYTVVVWHEKFGEKVGELSLAPKGKLEAKITFDAAQSSAASSSTLGLSVLELNSFSH
jgi:plastocyanin